MKRKTLVLSVFVMLLGMNLFAQQVSRYQAEKISKNLINYQQKQHQVLAVQSFDNDESQLAWIVSLSPRGFILVSSSENLRPVLAYSFRNNVEFEGEEGRIFTTLITRDIESRLAFPVEDVSAQQKIAAEWDAMLSGNITKTRYEQWPPEGTTPTGGWIFENWTQGSPYNKMCPIDGNTHQRSLTGCPATAMAMILHTLMDIRGTQLSDADDYYHSFGAGNQFWIDDDWQEFGFPRFDSLNLYLDSVQYNYESYKPLNTMEIAALNFACGVALKEVFSSSISGTWGIEQAADAWQRFGYPESRLVYDSDTSLCSDLAENIKNGWPAHLGLVDPPPTSVGHNVVVDGYNTDEYYHFNFGWGGNSNGWYTMPPTNIPYNLTVIEGIVLDIIGDNPHVGSGVDFSKTDESIKLYQDKYSGDILILSEIPEQVTGRLFLYAVDGRLLNIETVTLHTGQASTYHIHSLPQGIYILKFTDGLQNNTVLKFVK